MAGDISVLHRSFLVGVFVLPVLLLLMGCASAAQPDGTPEPGDSEAPIQTDQRVYTLFGDPDRGFADVAVGVIYTNRTEDTTYLARCGSGLPKFRLEKWINRAWVPAYRPACLPAEGGRPRPVAPGESHADMVGILYSRTPRLASKFLADEIEGLYRIVYAVAVSPSAGVLLPEKERVSNTFQILDPERSELPPTREVFSPPADSAAPIWTDQELYSLWQGDPDRGFAWVPIEGTYVNRTRDTVYLDPCGYRPPKIQLEKWVDGGWVPAYRAICPLVGVERPFPVAPGESRKDTVRIFYSRTPNFDSGYLVKPVTGMYRMLYDVSSHWNREGGTGAPLPKEQRVSNPFRIVEPQGPDG